MLYHYYKLRALDGYGTEEIVIYEWNLDGKPLSVISIYSPTGFLEWEATDDAFTGDTIKSFVERKLSLWLPPNGITIFDGASIHLTQPILHAINTSTNGRYKKVPAYCHFLSPIEKGFSNVWRLVRQLWAIDPRDAIGTLNQAFTYYSYRGAGGSSARGHFNVYDRNNNSFLDEQVSG